MKYLLYLAALACCCSVRADYLHWQIDQSGTGETPMEFSYAKILVQGAGVEEGTYLTISGSGATKTEVISSEFAPPEVLVGTKTAPVYAELGEFGAVGYSFAAELYRMTGEGDEFVGRSEFIPYGQLVEAFHVYSNMSTTGINPYVFSSFAVPEPTSGLLFLLGFAALSLRRRKTSAPSPL